MTAEFDEEVVFENSPLYQYLQDLGHTDFEICPTVSQEAEQRAEEKELQEEDVRTVPKHGVFSKLAKILKSPFLPCGQKDEQIHQLDVGFRLDCLSTILQQEAVLQEDVELIELLNPSILSAGQAQQPEGGHLPTLRSLATPNIWDVSVLLALVSTLVLLEYWSVSSWLTCTPSLLVLAVFVVSRAMKTWRWAKLQMTLRKYSAQLEATVVNSRAFTNLVRKALRLIQETEVISRGFTLVSAACPYDKSSQHPNQHLIGLRKAVYRSVRANFRASRFATLYMLKNYPLTQEIDNVTNYICVVPLKELGLGLSEQQVSEEEAHNLTDGFSLPALKVLFQLWIGQSSEFFRRLALLLSPENESSSGLEVSRGRLPHQIWRDVSGDLPQTHATCLAELRRSYEFYRYFETHHQSGSERPIKLRPKSGELSGLHRAVRSLQLHLKALLNELIIFEDELENLAGPKETQELTADVYEVLEQKLKLIQPHIQASNSCWEEAICQVDRMLRRHPASKDMPKPSCENSHCISQPLPPPAVLIEDKDPIPEEQELEACVEDIDLEQEFRKDEFYFWSQEDKERQKREREESKRVLQELKSVLGFKASEEERQKWKQLLFSEHAVMKPLSPAELEGSLKPPTDISAESTEPKDVHGALQEKTQDTASQRLRTEYESEDTTGAGNADVSADRRVSPKDEESTYHQLESEENSEQAGGDRAKIPKAVLGGALQSSIKDRLVRLQLSSDFSFSSELAAEVAARYLTFTSMKEQTFGDSEEEEEEEVQGNENHVEEGKDEAGHMGDKEL
ncbi:vezatin isoform X2 [Microcaecilia unicolor]|uniref:Vezatin n=1 Tax=Microcaecilia unicolor TaxID=1415580 RepID=A0A6P7Z269_9AMPH|nr:vezatin isoform X2 [Microcaecilia unicolor]